MTQGDAAKVVLVRAVEETLPDRIPPEILLEAHAAAGDPDEGSSWIVRRAAHLVDHALGNHRGVLARSDVALPAPWAVVGVAFVIGLASNYLGPAGRIHAVLNPIVLLVAWNVLVYAGLVLRRARRERRHGGEGTASLAPSGARVATGTPAAGAPAPERTGRLERMLLGRLFAWLLRARERVEEGVEQSRETARVARRFAVLWWPVVRPAAWLWLRRLLQLSAIGVAAGAVLGMYVRGLFFAYQVVWRSTFVNDPDTVALGLRVLLGPAAMLLGRPPPDGADVTRLVAPEGDPAAPWIHLYAVSALLYVVLPRSLLALAAGRELRRATRDVRVDLDAEYYRDLLRRARAVSPTELEASIRGAIHDECRQFAGRLADVVCVELYDRRITPRLHAFREQGGRLQDLEAALREECERFGPVIARELPSAQAELERALVVRVRRLMGDEGALEVRAASDLGAEVSVASSHAAMRLGERLSGDVASVVAGVVSASVAVVVGTVSGGFGEALGVALLVGLVESGPVGWLIGAVAGLVAAGAALSLGRERLREGVKSVPLPAALLKLVLWRGRWERLIADGRQQCEASVREALTRQIEPLSSALADHVWSGLRPMVGELQRPRVSP